MKITIFTEYNASMVNEEAKASYPEGMNKSLYDLFASNHEVKMIVHSKDDDGSELTEEILQNTDVLVWWGHWYHGLVADSVANLVVSYVNRGMGLLALHSAHESKVFQRLMGTSGALSWREMGENERVWFIEPNHPIVRGIEGNYIDIEHEEMYGEPFSIPAPDELVLVSWFRGGEVMRSGCVFNRGYGKIFFFRPGHETLPTYKYEKVQKLLLNAVEYIKPNRVLDENIRSVHVPNPPEKI
ncbi:MAG: ThuA domain-containing protein [Clostridia bacterium]|nr:ThuA domain-containing protein [Clostridia bacterium]MBR7141365.1 ThuA domain-containing protein [Clostridia bacterium]